MPQLVDAIPIWVLLAMTVLVIMIVVETGHRLGRGMKMRPGEEKLPPVSSILASTLGLLAFMLAFTFGLTTTRFDNRKALVRSEANMIRTVWLRSDFLPEPDRSEAEGLLRVYLDQRLSVGKLRERDATIPILAMSTRIQHRLWEMATANLRRQGESAAGSLYIDSLNQMFDLQAMRVVVGLESRVPTAVWVALYILIVLGTFLVGYQSAIAESGKRSWASLILALSFSVVIALIVSLDRPFSEYVTVSQQPFEDVRTWIATGALPPSH